MAGVLKYTRKDLASLVYHPVRPLDVISDEIGIPVEDIAKLDANENLHPVPEELMSAVTDALSSLSSGCSAQIYPDPTQTHLRAAIAKLHDVSPSQVCGGSGSDDILDIIMRLVDAETCIISPPTFGMYKFLGALTKIKIIEVPRKPDFAVNVEAVVASIRANKCRLVMLPSPNNPTGTLLPNEDIRILCKEDALIVVDEAYADFAGCSADELLAEYPNLVVCRTFSKWAGLAGLRAGYALGDPALIERMLAIKQPYNVNVAAEAMARAALTHREKILVTVRSLGAELLKTIAFLETYKFLTPYPTHSNFVLCEVGILIRYFGTQGGQLQNNIRISAGRPQDTVRLIAALEAFAAERFNPAAAATLGELKGVDCLLFDMDGVLLDVSQSYRQAILDTAAHFSVTGSGLKALERLLPSKKVLLQLKEKYKLAVVTGRPRSDCDFALNAFDLTDVFEVCTCMEDGIKPDAAPVTKALAALNCKTGILFGDTVDDCRAAVAAGISAIGVVAPGHSVKADTAVLCGAGAEAVLSEGMAELTALL
ncbi:pyridoxal phosphate-dependent transferase [Baffinella frigidus]|nr:pyridoxal phosphate-dependent transferase [Cryptophyta sp. CCMP2293]